MGKNVAPSPKLTEWKVQLNLNNIAVSVEIDFNAIEFRSSAMVI